jgi:phenylacetyl-CoA:acceptor oxidoreductase subunit 1
LEHFLPLGVNWCRLIAWEETAEELTTYPVRRNHCKEPPCVYVCPTGASQKREEDGIVWVDQDKCVGCRYCTIACPYQNRTFVSRDKDTGYFPGYELTDFEKAGRRLYPHTVGTNEKCNFCLERIDAGLAGGLNPGTDRKATPACVNVCPARALTFGDLDDPDSQVRKLIKESKGFQLHPEYDTDPSTYYIDKGL